ncbi:glycoside hydrolase family 15 [Oerskovia sp. Sa1BUA8]|uniref:Glycoside hydrolase family 15 n=1 Tax=Oerskovia douganii TaxID=2762210 RepID=A0A9D5U6U8_9CELL|nr:glycoside hydrolase family 15 [Oerskovia douganii]MBE7699255.1 glycoside hydrolase family 15 [Oerskovia douganii]
MRFATTRWRLAVLGAAIAPVVVLATAGATPAPLPTDAQVDLYQDGVATAGADSLLRLPRDMAATYLDGSRVLDPAALDPAWLATGLDPADGEVDRLTVIAGSTLATDQLLDPRAARRAADASRAWLAAGDVPGAGTRFADLGESALLDMHAMTLTNGASLAAASPRWRYVWPRDSSFTAAAYARTGHVDDALRVLDFLRSVQEPDGSFHARYLPDASGVPDERGLQSDGNGWALWSAWTVIDEIEDPGERAAAHERLAPLVDASTDYVLGLLDPETALPPPSSDYWEVHPTELTLGTAAPLLAGLEGALSIYADAERWDRAADAARAALRLRAAVEERFGPQGYPRHASGGPQDAATTFALPPFQPTALSGADEAWRSSVMSMLRPAGGVAPGAGWRTDGISWTPQTALFALAGASTGEIEVAESWLDWLDQHRTASGAIPEKVLADGSPAAVAPLTWSASLVVLTLAELEDQRAAGATLP